MNPDLLGLGFAAGLVAALNPCGFAMLPAYLTLVVNQSTAAGRGALCAVAATLTMTSGFLAVFAAFGALTLAVASTVQRYLPYGTIAIGITLIGTGLLLTAGRRFALPLPEAIRGLGGAPSAQAASMFGYGVAYAVASLSCTAGPFLAVTTAAARGGSVPGTVAVYGAYALGFALLVGTLAVAAALAGRTGQAWAGGIRLRRLLPVINRIGGVLVVAVGAYVTYYGWYELRLRDSAAAFAVDPVIAAAGRLQGAIAGWVHQNGALPWVLVLAVLLVPMLGWGLRRR